MWKQCRFCTASLEIIVAAMGWITKMHYVGCHSSDDAATVIRFSKEKATVKLFWLARACWRTNWMQGRVWTLLDLVDSGTERERESEKEELFRAFSCSLCPILSESPLSISLTMSNICNAPKKTCGALFRFIQITEHFLRVLITGNLQSYTQHYQPGRVLIKSNDTKNWDFSHFDSYNVPSNKFPLNTFKNRTWPRNCT